MFQNARKKGVSPLDDTRRAARPSVSCGWLEIEGGQADCGQDTPVLDSVMPVFRMQRAIVPGISFLLFLK